MSSLAPRKRLAWALTAGGVLLSTLATARVVANKQQVRAQKSPAAYPQNVANRPVPRLGIKPWIISPAWRAEHERLRYMAAHSSAELLFLGDSITEGWGVAPAYREHFGKYSTLNLGLAGDTTQNVLWRLEHGALNGAHPRVVVILIGINNVAGGFSPEDTSAGVRSVVDAVQNRLPAARVVLLAILPAGQDAETPLRQRIQETNRLLEGLPKPDNVQLYDIGGVLLEPDGSIARSTLRDFLHPTAEGFERLSRALEPLLEPLLAPANE
jgi:lysophospholipase L1-like esterase